MTELTPIFVLMSEYRRPIAEVEAAIPRHSERVGAAYQLRRILVSGGRDPSAGGLIVATGKDRGDIEEWIATYPFVLADLAEYTI
jgi:uncharacterized protein YciI